MAELTASARRGFAVVFLLIGLIGLADATFLTAKKFTNGPLPCFVTSGCEVVTSSAYAMVGPVPVSLLGVAYYLTIVVLSLVAFDTKQDVWLRRLAWLTWAGFAFSLYLVYLMAFVLQAYCFYCLVSAGTSLTLFVVGLAVLRRLPRSGKENTVLRA